ncbi:CAP domain-containing protein [Paenibacillus xanthanilyticus]|uniref:CAP domain-containing protein n=1 Tax=Paenibacillus xanthanilyticus TaxID=1783531 RepID=A0ABV8K2N4_9BACL
MKKSIVLAALLLAAGCSGDHATPEQQSVDPVRTIETQDSAAPSRSMNQASSIALEGGSGQGSLRAKQLPGITVRIGQGQLPNGATYWTGQYPAGGPYGSGQPMTGWPTGTKTQQPAVRQPAVRQPVAQQPAAQQPAADASQFAQQVLTIVNKERANAGLKPLSMNASLSKVAMAKAQDMHNNNYFSHQSPTYGSPFDMIKAFGITYRTAGENIAKGQRTPQEVMTQWMNSPGHRANILKNGYTQIGIAYYKGEWVQQFIG